MKSPGGGGSLYVGTAGAVGGCPCLTIGDMETASGLEPESRPEV